MPTATTDIVGSSSSNNTTSIIVGVLVVLQIVSVLSFCGICLSAAAIRKKKQKFKISTGMLVEM